MWVASPTVSVFPELLVISFHIIPSLCVTSLTTCCSGLNLVCEPYLFLKHLLLVDLSSGTLPVN